MTELLIASPSSDQAHAALENTKKRLGIVSLTALGVVYGDIGTSPLYALRECFKGAHRILPTASNILGVLSLIFWALILVISIKYLSYVMRADNGGEGGILALLALLKPWGKGGRKKRSVLVALGLFGAALLYGDGMITPAISVLSAVEGLEVATPVLQPYVIPLTLVILALLFLFQQRGTAGIGSVFGPVMVVWFVVLAVMGISGIVRRPEVLVAANPIYGLLFFLHNGWLGFLVLGAVFLVVTGGEALYADMGHFGPRPIRLAWFALVLPALLLNYFGQGALLLANPNETTQPFYHLAPPWALYPLVLLATLATIIASQAVISGAFSLTRQAVQLGVSPRLEIRQTSSEEIGQIYIPSVNWVLMLATMALVLGFGSSSNLAAAYGVAVTTTMVITTLLAFVLVREQWHWRLPVAGVVTVGFLAIDLSFFGANLLKIPDGGWFPLIIGGAVFLLMATWQRGRALLARRLRGSTQPLHLFLHELMKDLPPRVPGTAIFVTAHRSSTPPMLLHHLEHNQVLHEQVVLLTVITEAVPRVPPAEHLQVVKLEDDFFQVTLHYGFMQSPNVPAALAAIDHDVLDVDLEHTTYFLGRVTLLSTERPGMARWREHLFAFMSRNAARATDFFQLPPDRVIEIGIQVDI